MATRSQISEHLAMYLNENIDLDSFEDWIVVNTWNIHLSQDAMAERLAFAIEESLAEHSSGHISEAKLKEEFRSLLLDQNPQRVMELEPFFAGEYPVQVIKSSSNGSVIVIRELGAPLREIRSDLHGALI